MKRMAIVLMVWTILPAACKDRGQPTDLEGQYADFWAFYERFHADSLYQMEHITFPLEGLPPYAGDAIRAAGDFRWQEDDWEIQHPIDFSAGIYQRKLFQPMEGVIVEQIVHRSGAFGMLRRFAKQGDGEWRLIYYAAPQGAEGG